jgi:glycosyltransferase involved in cell wall biosynthesis
MANVFLVDLEAVDTRYTGQWKTHVPALLQKQGHHVEIISGPTDIPAATTPGAFLNFGGTNIYKARQVEQMGRLFCDGRIHAGDHFIFTDAWHPGIINLKYMSELLQTPVTIHALWHAGSYDPQDFLGRLIGDRPWVRHAECSFFDAVDHNYFATQFHIDLFANTFLDADSKAGCRMVRKIVKSGWPMEYMVDTLEPYKNLKKRDLVLFPHRIAPEKQVEIFRDLAKELPEYEFVVCQDTPLTKHEYHTLLGEAKVVFSANLQETLGISCYEGALVGAIPMVPDRLSYSEMYDNWCKYPSVFTESWDEYVKNKPALVQMLREHMTNYEHRIELVRKQANALTQEYFSADLLLRNIQ